MQLFGNRFLAVPRFVWVFVAAVITLLLSLGGRNEFEHILQNLLPILGYWTICFGLVLLIEHYIVRPKLGGYDLEGWLDANRTPRGFAGIATLCSALGLSFLGMNQTWVSLKQLILWSLLNRLMLTISITQYAGPLAKKIGAYGGDVGDYVVIIVAIVLYPVSRALEIKFVGR